jgi:DNA processing protein
MSSPTERAALVALLRSGKRPWQSYADLVEEAGSALSVLEDEVTADGEQTTLFAGDCAEPLTAARAEIASWEAAGFQLLTILDSDYPENLRAVYDRPPLVFLAGRFLPADARAVAVVGARKPSPRAIRAASDIARHLVSRRFTVVSGLATGVDTAAHRAALAAAGRTVAVIGTGLSRAYPPANAALQRQVADEGAVISQFWPDAPPSRRSFPMRNAVMSGLALATVVVEASQTSGARLQARLALAHGRPVFLMQTLVDEQPWAREFAHRPGTYVVRAPADISSAIERLTSSDALVS